MALPASDNFDRADGGLGANWTTPTGAGALAVSFNRCTGTASTDSFGYWSADAFSGDQYCQFVVSDANTADHAVCVRMQNGGASGPQCYLWQLYHAGSGDIIKMTNGWSATTTLASRGTFPFADGDVARIEVSGTTTVTIRVFKNGVQVGADITDSSSTITGGAPGIFNFGNVSSLDDFEGGNLSNPPTAALTGTATTGITEADIVAGGKTIIITLTNDTWVTAGATFDAIRQDIINGLDSAQSEANGWDAVVKAGAAVTDVVRTSNTVVTITLEAFASYNITVQETITVTVPISATDTAVAPIIATPTFNVAAVGGFVPGGQTMENQGLRAILSM